MQLRVDPYERGTLYADLREDEALVPALRERAISRAAVLGARHVELWRPPYGEGEHPMAGFIELVFVPPAAAPVLLQPSDSTPGR